MKKFLKDVSIIIVNYNTVELTRNCINSILEHTKYIDYEIIVSDNGSTDDSTVILSNEFPQVVFIENNCNLGFGAANNVAAKIAKGKYIFYLNSDTILLNNAVKMFYDFWESSTRDDIGVLGAQLLNAEHQPAQSWAKYPTPLKVLKALVHMYVLPEIKRKNKLQTPLIAKEGIIIDGYITGADMFLKNNESAFFDERYFMYAEEADLEYNHFYLKNKVCIIVPEIQIIHLEGGSDKSEKVLAYDFGKKSAIYLWLSYIKYLRKNFPKSKIIIFIIKKMLLYIWKKKYYIDRTRMFIEELKII